jgi:hypothetical protein
LYGLIGAPRRDGDTFERTSGNVSLLIESGKLWNGEVYGTRRRLGLVHVSSDAVRSRSPMVEVWHSVREFLPDLAVSTSGEEYANFNRQMRALAAAGWAWVSAGDAGSEADQALLG